MKKYYVQYRDSYGLIQRPTGLLSGKEARNFVEGALRQWVREGKIDEPELIPATGMGRVREFFYARQTALVGNLLLFVVVRVAAGNELTSDWWIPVIIVGPIFLFHFIFIAHIN